MMVINTIKTEMLFNSQQFVFRPLTAVLLLLLAGCGGDGLNVSDNTSSGPQSGGGSVSNGGGLITTLTFTGSPGEIDNENLGSVEAVESVVDGSNNIIAVWLQAEGYTDSSTVNLWANDYSFAGGSWGTAQKIETASGKVKSHRLVVDSGGNAMAVWTQDTVVQVSPEVVRTDLWASRYNGVTWSVPEAIDAGDLPLADTDGVTDIDAFEVVVDSADVITVIWSQHDGVSKNLYQNRYAAGWGGAAVMESDAGDVSGGITVKVAGTKLYVLWTQKTGTYLDLWGKRYSGGWEVEQKLDTTDAADASSPSIIVDSAAGPNATVVWTQSDGADINLWAIRHDGANWVGAQAIENDAGDVAVPQLAVDSDDNEVMVVWRQYDGTVNNIRYNRYSGGWGVDNAVEIGSGESGSPVLVRDSGNNITVIWRQTESSLDHLWANRYSSVLDDWEGAAKIETQDDGSVQSYSLMIDGADRVTAIWRQEDSTGLYDLWSNRATGSGTWGSAEQVEGLSGNAQGFVSAMDGAGNITVLWAHPVNSIDQLVSNKYSVASGWGDVVRVEQTGKQRGEQPQLLIDSANNVTALWLQAEIVEGSASRRKDLWANSLP